MVAVVAVGVTMVMVAVVAVGVTMVMVAAVPIVVVQVLNTAPIPNHRAAQRMNTAPIPNQRIPIAPAAEVPMQNPLAIRIIVANHHQVQDHP